jgi:hypothetical protein
MRQPLHRLHLGGGGHRSQLNESSLTTAGRQILVSPRVASWSHFVSAHRRHAHRPVWPREGSTGYASDALYSPAASPAASIRTCHHWVMLLSVLQCGSPRGYLAIKSPTSSRPSREPVEERLAALVGYAPVLVGVVRRSLGWDTRNCQHSRVLAGTQDGSSRSRDQLVMCQPDCGHRTLVARTEKGSWLPRGRRGSYLVSAGDTRDGVAEHGKLSGHCYGTHLHGECGLRDLLLAGSSGGNDRA